MDEETVEQTKKPRKPNKRTNQKRAAFTGFRRPDTAFFRLPNEWADIIAEITSLAELKIIEDIARHTWSFNEFGKRKEISTK